MVVCLSRIDLTKGKIYINTHHIVAFEKYHKGTLITTTINDLKIVVEETPEEICKLIQPSYEDALRQDYV